jgi:hypothetical protein
MRKVDGIDIRQWKAHRTEVSYATGSDIKHKAAPPREHS